MPMRVSSTKCRVLLSYECYSVAGLFHKVLSATECHSIAGSLNMELVCRVSSFGFEFGVELLFGNGCSLVVDLKPLGSNSEAEMC
ncbi:hypothetical protein Drorol1_Dr00012234 [Drosera rotundifolia]